MLKRTSLYEYHKENSRLVEFAGYEMPIWYTSIIEEHMAVRNNAGIFDVSHMGRIIVKGQDAGAYIDRLVPTHVSTQAIEKSVYTLFLNDACRITDDLIILKRSENEYLLVVNASNIQKDYTHMEEVSKEFKVEIHDITSSSTMIAVQGPKALQTLRLLIPAELDIKRFRNIELRMGGRKVIITRTGYTGEDGFEIILYETDGDKYATMKIWNELAKSAKPCGLGARDSLRIEAGLPLYGSDIDENTNPIEADLHWVVSKDKQGFIGFERLKELENTPPSRVRRGLILSDKIPRKSFEILDETDEQIGHVTSGTFSPILRKGIALAYLDSRYSQSNQSVRVNVREALVEARVVKPPFYDETKYGWKRTSK